LRKVNAIIYCKHFSVDELPRWCGAVLELRKIAAGSYALIAAWLLTCSCGGGDETCAPCKRSSYSCLVSPGGEGLYLRI